VSAQNTVGNDSVVVQTTEGWLELFLTPSEKATFSNWKEELNDKSLTHWLTRDFFETLSSYIPDTVAPNVVTVAGFLCLGQAWYMTNLYGDDFPTACTWFAVLNIFAFFLTNSMETYHADRIRQRTALGELFKYSCNSLATVFLAILTTYCLGGTSVKIQWYAVQACQLVLFLKHLSAFNRMAGLRYNVFTGPGEVIMTSMILLTLRATNGLDWVLELYENTLHRLIAHLDGLTESQLPTRYQEDPMVLGMELVMLTYYSLYVVAVVKCLSLKKPHGWSRFGLSASLLMRSIPAVFLHFGVSAFDLKTVDVICDGFFMAVLTSDVTLAKMAGREIHPWVVLMSMAAVLSHSTILALVLVYYIAVFADLCAYLNMPLLTTCRNVYCDGVYDLCHIGHKMLFQKALSYGNRLFVGVVGDEDASHYKRPPIMTSAERCAEVEACKAVTKVIPNAPCFGLTEEFLNEHEIHVVAFGEEYLERYPDPNDDPYYKVPRLMGIAQPLPRTKGLSTSDLIRRIQESQPADEKKSPT
jgi:cytidyltransferase-like protein